MNEQLKVDRYCISSKSKVVHFFKAGSDIQIVAEKMRIPEPQIIALGSCLERDKANIGCSAEGVNSIIDDLKKYDYTKRTTPF